MIFFCGYKPCPAKVFKQSPSKAFASFYDLMEHMRTTHFLTKSERREITDKLLRQSFERGL